MCLAPFRLTPVVRLRKRTGIGRTICIYEYKKGSPTSQNELNLYDLREFHAFWGTARTVSYGSNS